MSRIGKKPVELPSGVSATVSGQTIEVKGPKGTLNFSATDDVTISMADNSVAVEPRGHSKRARQQWGMSRTMVANMVKGVSEGCLLYTSPSPRDRSVSRMPSSA